MGRPPIGARAMTPAEKQRRYRERKFGNKPRVTKSPAAVAALEARIRELEAELARRGRSQLTRSRQERDTPELMRLRGENAKLKSNIVKLKAMLAEEPDAAKLSKKVVEQRVEMASLRQNIKILVKERD